MDGIAIQSNISAARNTQLLGRSKGVNGPRKVLAEIQNVQQNKAVSFDANCNKPSKKTTQVNRNITNTPSVRPNKILGSKTILKTPGIKSSKGACNSIKIYEDTKHVTKKPVVMAKSNYDVPECKEYMAPCTDGEFHIPLPDYLEKAMKLKPSFNIDYFSKRSDVIPSEEYVMKANEEYIKASQSTSKSTTVNKVTNSTEDYLLPLLSDMSLNERPHSDDYVDPSLSNVKLLDEDIDLLLQMESDDSFSLETLDRELRSAGLEVPEWGFDDSVTL